MHASMQRQRAHSSGAAHGAAAPRRPGAARWVVRRSSATAPTLSTVSSTTPQQGLVDRVLAAVEGTDGGIDMSAAQRADVESCLDQLEAIGQQQQPRPLDNPLLWGNYEVAFTSTSRAPSERGQPAGGRFRGRIGRALFRTTGVFQSVLQPGVATNKVAFKLFGLLPGAVGLRGKILPLEAGAPHAGGRAGVGDTVRVLFERPVLSLGDSLHLCIGPPSSVQLCTTYVDERVRLGKGNRGSLFVFKRGGAADAAGMAEVGLQRSTPAGLVWLGAAFAAMLGGGWALWTTQVLAARVLAAAVWSVALGLALVVRSGGVDEDDAADAAAAAAAAAAAPAPA